MNHFLPKMLSFLSLFLFAFLLSGQELPPLEEWIGEDAAIFQTINPGTFLKFSTDKGLHYFRWTSDKKTEARYPAYRNSPEWTYCGQPVSEVTLLFTKEGLQKIYLAVYNKGDNGQISQADFNAILKKLETHLVETCRQKGKESNTRIGGKSTLNQKLWELQNGIVICLRSSATGKKASFRPEFIQVTYERRTGSKLAPADVKDSLETGKVRTRTALTSNLGHDSDGTVFLDNIPMVDQGDKGYCCVAVTERVLRYYGFQQINQHLMAQLAESSAQSGTQMDNFTKAIKYVGQRLGLRYRIRYELLFENLKDVEKFLKRYNAVAAKKGKPTVTVIVKNNMIYVGETLEQMDPEVYSLMRQADKTKKSAFLRDIKNYVDKGIPLIWSVQLGIIQEEGLRQTRSGHLRLITGYNLKEKSIVYSDTWGAGHEKKKMSMDDAWTITHAMMVLEPTKLQ